MGGDHKPHHDKGHGEHKQVDHHHEHHVDHHDHHEDPFARYKGTPLDFSQKHPVFDIKLDKKGPEFSEIDDKRFEYIKNYAGRVEVPEYEVPKNIAGNYLLFQV